ncbi:bahd acyltransferase [Sparganum proliferum]
MMLPETSSTTVSAATASTRPLLIRASDPDFGLNSHLVYRFVGAGAQRAAELFEVDSHTGVLRLRAGGSLDRETEPSYLFTLEVSDSPPTGSALTAAALLRFRIDVLDVNDSPPVFLEPVSVVTVALPTQPNASVAQFLAHDADLDDVVSDLPMCPGKPLFTIMIFTDLLPITSSSPL